MPKSKRKKKLRKQLLVKRELEARESLEAYRRRMGIPLPPVDDSVSEKS